MMSSPATLSTWLAKLDTLKQELDALRPLPVAVVEQLQQFYRVGLTYSNNALEGNTLTEGETKLLLESGITVGGKLLLHQLEAVGHADALDSLFIAIQANSYPTEQHTTHLHKVLLQKILPEQVGAYRKTSVLITGTPFMPPPASQVPILMQQLFTDQLPAWCETYHPIIATAMAHQQFVNIHPFVDGNGRMARLLSNWLLLSAGYPPFSIPFVLRMEYLNALRGCQEVTVSEINSLPLTTFIAEVAYEGMKDYLRMVNRLLSV
jgi:Fic family protein